MAHTFYREEHAKQKNSLTLLLPPPPPRTLSSRRCSVDLTRRHSFACDEFYERLRLEPEDVLGRPLTSIVDPRDAHALRTAVFHVISLQNTVLGSGSAQERGGTLVQVRVACGGLSCQANMSMSIGSQGLIVVTRLYGV